MMDKTYLSSVFPADQAQAKPTFQKGKLRGFPGSSVVQSIHLPVQQTQVRSPEPAPHARATTPGTTAPEPVPCSGRSSVRSGACAAQRGPLQKPERESRSRN